MDRRSFLALTSTMPFLGLENFINELSSFKTLDRSKNISLRKDPNKIIDLHRSLKYKLISTKGSPMTDGFKVPHLADGMGAFNVNGDVVLVRNHELIPRDGMLNGAFDDPSSQIKDLGSRHYDPIAIGGTTTIVLDRKTKRVKKEFLSLSGTRNNCAGGITPWNTWLSCEEDIDKKNSWRKSHGYVFEVDPAKPDLSTPVPLKALGRFMHEAVAFDKYGNAYLTEDRSEGLIYKFIPKKKGSLIEGELFALKVENVEDSRNWNQDLMKTKNIYQASWIKVDDVDPEDDTMRFDLAAKGATPFARPEGITSDQASIYVTCTSGGKLNKGQIFKLNFLSQQNTTIELWLESEKDDQINMPDNVTIAPWGDLIVCEDNSKINRLWGFNQTGGSYLIAENSYTGSEFAGVCFSPLDNTMYVNLQYNGMTLAIDGNWKKLRR